jgi:four helix bundle protein
MKTHKDLDVWKEAISLVIEIYELLKEFPAEEKYGLVNQIKRSAVSIPSNIAEGASRNSDKDFIRFLHIATGSLSELETQLIISKGLGFLCEDNFKKISIKLTDIRKMILGLIKYLRSREKINNLGK